MDEVAIGGAVGGGDIHVGFGDGSRVGDLRQHHGDARTQHGAELLPSYKTASFVLFPVVFKMILIAHMASSPLPSCAANCARTGYYTRVRPQRNVHQRMM